MKKSGITGLVLGLLLSTAALAQTQTQQTSSANMEKSGQRNTSSREGLNRKGGVEVGREGSPKMKEGVSRAGNSNLSPTSPTNVPPPGGDKKNASGGGAVAGSKSTAKTKKTEKPAIPVQKPVKSASGTRNGNMGSSAKRPVKTQGSTSEGSASVPANGGAPGTGTPKKQ